MDWNILPSLWLWDAFSPGAGPDAAAALPPGRGRARDSGAGAGTRRGARKAPREPRPTQRPRAEGKLQTNLFREDLHWVTRYRKVSPAFPRFFFREESGAWLASAVAPDFVNGLCVRDCRDVIGPLSSRVPQNKGWQAKHVHIYIKYKYYTYLYKRCVLYIFIYFYIYRKIYLCIFI